MTRDQAIGSVWALGWLALIGSSLVARRIPRGRILRLVALWVAIFAACWFAVVAAKHGHSDAAAPSRAPDPLSKAL